MSCASLLLAAAVSAEPAATADLEGLWVARARYGPDVRGRLMILKRGDGVVADIAGFSVPVRQQGRKLSFDLPDGKGSFRGEHIGGAIDGQWIQPATVESGARYATPVVLRADGDERWTGEVLPRADHMTYYLPVTRGSDGRYSAYLRNPERNQGVFLGVSRIEQDGDTIRLIGTRGQDKENIIASGPLDSESGRFSLPLPRGTFDFARDNDGSSPFYARGNPPQRYDYVPPVQLDDGWPVSTLEQEGIDEAMIEKFVQKLIDMPQENVSTSQVHSVLIARHGKLVLEEYFHGFDRDTPHDTRSAAKSWTNVLIGAAMQAGVPDPSRHAGLRDDAGLRPARTSTRARRR